jgi:SAM-dependent methyltransferase
MHWLWPTVTAAIVVDGLSLRRRLEAFAVLDDPPADVPVASRHRFVTAAGVEVDDATARSASIHARQHALEALDLVPANLPTERLLDLARLVDPATFREDALADGRGALQAVLVTEELASRVGITTFDGLPTDEMIALTARLKDYAPRAMGHALAPALRAGPAPSAGRLAGLQAAVGAPFMTAGLLADLALLAGAARSRRPWALAAVAARALQPVAAVVGTPALPRDLPFAVPARLVSSARDLPRTLRRWRAAADVEPRRKAYDAALAGGLDRFFGPRRDDCPLCGSGDLHVRLVTEDLIQCKPGTFTLEACGGCGHVFQNPQLTAEGLDFYYRDFYDGAQETAMDAAFTRFRPFYTARAETVRGVATPRRWLDVGAGHGHFALMAREAWPDTTFDGLDMSESILEAERRGWTDTSYHGTFPEHAPALAGRYDVVSMFHYLEHTPDPLAELDAAATVLGPSGLLMIEVPDPESRLAGALGRYWPPWGQPQHLHFVSVANLTRLLRDRGFDVVRLVRGPAGIPLDVLGAASELVNAVQPPVAVPWAPRPTAGALARRGAAMAAGAPLVAAGAAIDTALRPLGGLLGTSNTYRLLAARTPL